jgi:hypothetical protein
MEPHPFDLDLLAVTLAFDSATSLPRRGVRRMHHEGRHLLFEADDLCVDLRLEPDIDTGAIAVHGQLADRRDPLKGLGGSAVLLMEGERVAGWMFGNRNGEFVFEVRPGTGLRLCLPITDRGRIEIPLDALLVAEDSAAEATSRLGL